MFGAGRIFAERYVLDVVDPGRRLFDCSAPACAPSDAADPIAWLGLGLALALAVLAVVLRTRAPAAGAALAWAGLLFLPVSNLVVLGPVPYGERLLYLPAIGLCLAAGVGFDALARRARRPGLALALPLLVVALNAPFTVRRALEWRDFRSLLEADLRRAPDNAFLRYDLAAVLLDEKEWALAEAHAREAMRLWPRYAAACDVLGVAVAVAVERQGGVGEAESVMGTCLARGLLDTTLVEDHATLLARRGALEEALAEVRGARAKVARTEHRERLGRLEERLVRALARPRDR